VLPQLVEMAREIGDVNPTTFAVGAAALLLLIPARYVAQAVVSSRQYPSSVVCRRHGLGGASQSAKP
jgi:hypothetical protein